MNLRKRLSAAIERRKGDSNAGAIEVLRVLESAGFSLYGNGWLEDNPVALKALGYGDEVVE